MKLSLVGPVYPYRGGISHYNTALANALLHQGHSTQIVSFRRQYPAWLYPGESDRDTSTQYQELGAQYLLDPFYPWSWWGTAKAIAQYAPDFALIQWWVTFWGPTDFVLARLLKRMGIPVVYLIHNTLPHEAKPWDRWLARLALRQGAAFIAQNPNDEAKLIRLLPTAKILRCKIPAFQPFQPEMIAKEEARTQMGLPVDANLLLFFGIVRPYKGLAYLLQALAQTLVTSKALHLVIAGEFWEDVGNYEQMVDELRLRSQITIINRYIPNEEAHLIFCSVDALVAPYTGGSQSAVASLALGYGLPMIVSERVAAGMVEGHSDQVIVVPGENVSALVEAINTLFEKPLQKAGDYRGDDWGKLIQVLEDVKSGIV